MKKEKNTIIIPEGKFSVETIKFEEDDKSVLFDIYNEWISLNKKMKNISGREINLPEGFAEAAFCVTMENINCVRVTGTLPPAVNSTWDCYDLYTQKRIEIKASTSQYDLISFGFKADWDDLYFINFYNEGLWDGTFEIYHIENQLLYNLQINKGETFRELLVQRRRPRISIYREIILRYEIEPLAIGNISKWKSFHDFIFGKQSENYNKYNFQDPISRLSVGEFKDKLSDFKKEYIVHWKEWLETNDSLKAETFGSYMRKWQACRPNKMRRIKSEQKHLAPFLEDILKDTSVWCKNLEKDFDITDEDSFTEANCRAIKKLWFYFEDNLVYDGKANNGKASIVGISKAILFLTNGAVGPAFDKNVKQELNIKTSIENPDDYIEVLKLIQNDISLFEKKNSTSIEDSAIGYSHLGNGRIIDMLLGPKEK